MFWRRRGSTRVWIRGSADSRSPGCGPLLLRITFGLCAILGWPIHAAELCLGHAQIMTLLPTYIRCFCLFTSAVPAIQRRDYAKRGLGVLSFEFCMRIFYGLLRERKLWLGCLIHLVSRFARVQISNLVYIYRSLGAVTKYLWCWSLQLNRVLVSDCTSRQRSHVVKFLFINFKYF